MALDLVDGVRHAMVDAVFLDNGLVSFYALLRDGVRGVVVAHVEVERPLAIRILGDRCRVDLHAVLQQVDRYAIRAFFRRVLVIGPVHETRRKPRCLMGDVEHDVTVNGRSIPVDLVFRDAVVNGGAVHVLGLLSEIEFPIVGREDLLRSPCLAVGE